MRAGAPVPLLWFRAGWDDDGGARRHSGLPLHGLQQRSQPPGHPAGEVSALKLRKHVHSLFFFFFAPVAF